MRATRYTLITLSVSLVAVVAAAVPAAADEPQLYTALKHETLFAALNVTPEGPPSVWYPGAGVAHRVNSSALAVRIKSFNLAVHPSRASAEEASARLRDTAEVGPRATARFPDLGDARYVWERGSAAGDVTFLRQNISVRFAWSGTLEDGMALARRIDQLIQTDRAIAPRGTFAQTPEIVSTSAPATIAKRGTASIRPDVRGLGAPQKTMVKVVDVGQGNELARGKAGETLTLRAPRDVYGTKPVRLLMVAASEDNVFVAKEFTIEVTE
jgi:hypothetical protein